MKPRLNMHFAPFEKMAKMKLTLALTGLFLISLNARANHYDWYNVLTPPGILNTISPQKVIPTTSVTPTQYFVAIAYGISASTGLNVPVLAKFDFYGNNVWFHTYPIAALPGAQLYATCVTEDLNPSSPGYDIAGDYTMGGISGVFVIKTDVNGNVLWCTTWVGGTGSGTKAIMVSHDATCPANMYSIMVASMEYNPGQVIVLYKVGPGGSPVMKQDYPDASVLTLRDGIEISKSSPLTLDGFYLLADRNVSGKLQPCHIFQPWGCWTPAPPLGQIYHYNILPSSIT